MSTSRGVEIARRVGYSGPVRQLVTGNPTLAHLSTTFIGGQDAASAVDTVARLNAAGLYVSAHGRMGAVRDSEGAARHVVAAAALVAALSGAGLAAGNEISIKLDQLGLLSSGGADLAGELLEQVVRTAEAADVLVTVDMEGQDEVEATLSTVRSLRTSHPTLGVAVQSCLRRAETDCADLAVEGSRVRLVKGGYPAEPGSTVGRRHDVDRAFVRCLRILMTGAGYPMVATHDPRLIEISRTLAARAGRAPDDHEFQMLLGLRVDEQRRLAAEGETVRVYVPYGPDWYDWCVNRLTDRPANVLLVARSLLPGR